MLEARITDVHSIAHLSLNLNFILVDLGRMTLNSENSKILIII